MYHMYVNHTYIYTYVYTFVYTYDACIHTYRGQGGYHAESPLKICVCPFVICRPAPAEKVRWGVGGGESYFEYWRRKWAGHHLFFYFFFYREH